MTWYYIILYALYYCVKNECIDFSTLTLMMHLLAQRLCLMVSPRHTLFLTQVSLKILMYNMYIVSSLIIMCYFVHLSTHVILSYSRY